jgi:hypothetical protein
MTTEHPITPPPELVSKWCYEDGEEIKSSPRWFVSVCAKAAQWGADQELEACCEWLKAKHWIEPEFADELRAARRPKPRTLKQRALKGLDVMIANGHLDGELAAAIREVLEASHD